MKLSSSLFLTASLATIALAADCTKVIVTTTSTRTLLQAFTTITGTSTVIRTVTPPIPTTTTTIAAETRWDTIYSTISDLLEVTPTTYINGGVQTVTATITCNPPPAARMVKAKRAAVNPGPQTLIRQVRKRQADCGTATYTVTETLYQVWYTQPIAVIKQTTTTAPTPDVQTVTITLPATTRTTTIPYHVPKYWTTKYLGSTRYAYVFIKNGQVVNQC